MRRITKEELPATVFVNELLLQVAENPNGYHPDYDEGAFRDHHYLSVFFSLLSFQNGLCAYTESILSINPDLINSTNSFVAGQVRNTIVRKGMDADIEHYAPNLKINYGWEIDNLFLCRVFINRDIKKKQETLEILKPDSPAYSPEQYLRYNFGTHRFIANPDIPDENLKEQITHQLDNVLGINAETIISERSTMLTSFHKYISGGYETYESIRDTELKQFYTAFEMSEADLKS